MASSTDILLNIVADTQNATKGLKSFQDTIGKTAKAVGALGIAFAGLKFSTGFIKQSSEFEARMRNINSLAQVNEQQFAAWGDSVLELSNKLQTASATDLAASLYDIQSAGFAGAEGMKVLEVSTNAAAAGNANATSMTNALVKALNSYGESASQAERYANVFQKTVSEGIITAEELSGVIGNATGLASSLNVGIEEVAASIALMTKKGVSASESTTKLNAVFNAMIKPSKEASDMANKLGLNMSAARVKSEGFEVVLGDIIKKTNGSEKALATLLGSTEAVTAVLKIGGEQGAEYSKQLAAIKDNTNAVNKALKEQSKSYQFLQKRLGVLTTNLKTELGEVSQEAVKPLLENLVGLLEGFNNLDNGMRQGIIQLAVFTPAVASLTLGVGLLTKGIIAANIASAPWFAGLAVAVGTITALGLAFAAWHEYTELFKNSANELDQKIGNILSKLDLIGKAKAWVWMRKHIENTNKSINDGAEAWKVYHAVNKKEKKTVEDLTKQFEALQTIVSNTRSPGATKKWVAELNKVGKKLKEMQGLGVGEGFIAPKKDSTTPPPGDDGSGDARKKARDSLFKKEADLQYESIKLNKKAEEKKLMDIKKVYEDRLYELQELTNEGIITVQERNALEKTAYARWKKEELKITQEFAQKRVLAESQRLDKIQKNNKKATKQKKAGEVSIITWTKNAYDKLYKDNNAGLKNQEITRQQYFKKEEQLIADNIKDLEEIKKTEKLNADERADIDNQLSDLKIKNIDLQNAKMQEQFFEINRVIGVVQRLGSAFESSSSEAVQALGKIVSSAGETAGNISGFFGKIASGDFFGATVQAGEEILVKPFIKGAEAQEILNEAMEDGIFTERERQEYQVATASQMPWFGGLIGDLTAQWNGLNDAVANEEKQKEREKQLKEDTKAQGKFLDKMLKEFGDYGKKKNKINKEIYDAEEKNQELILDGFDKIQAMEDKEIEATKKKYQKEYDLIDKKISKLNGVIRKELAGIEKIDKRLKQLTGEEDVEKRKAGAIAFQTAVADTRSKLHEDFYATTVNKSEKVNFKEQKAKIEDQFLLGKISLEKKNELDRNLAAKKYLYYDSLAKKLDEGSVDRQEVMDKARQARAQFLTSFIASSEKQQEISNLQAQKQLHNKKIGDTRVEINDQLKKKADLWKEENEAVDGIGLKFKEITDSWATGILNPLIEADKKLKDLFKQRQKAETKVETKQKARTTFKQQTKAPQLTAEKLLLSGATKDPREANKMIKGISASQQALKNIWIPGLGFLGDKMPGFASGGIVNQPQIAKVGEQGSEMILNQQQMSNLFGAIKGGNLGGNSVININFGNVQVGSNKDMIVMRDMIDKGIEKGLAKKYNNRYY